MIIKKKIFLSKNFENYSPLYLFRLKQKITLFIENIHVSTQSIKTTG
jgi:hypothetical protein